jgi:hypothetical protein
VDKSSAGIANEATNAASTKNAQNEQMTEIERKNKIREVLKKLIPQMKTGCKKQICFNKNCKNNILTTYTFANDQELLTHCLQQIQDCSVPDFLICHEAVED